MWSINTYNDSQVNKQGINMLALTASLVERYDNTCWRIGFGKLLIPFLLLLAFCFFLYFFLLALSKGKLTSIILMILLQHITHCKLVSSYHNWPFGFWHSAKSSGEEYTSGYAFKVYIRKIIFRNFLWKYHKWFTTTNPYSQKPKAF